MAGEPVPSKKPPFLLAFAPENWGEVERFRKLWPSTYKFDHDEQSFIAGAEAHFHKFQVLRGLVTEHLPALEKDRAELERDNFTNANEARKVAALVEAMLGELYSMMDCARKTLFLALPGCTPDGHRSLGRFLEDATKGRWAAGVPDPIKKALADTKWFDEPLNLRNQSVHSDPGNCHQGKDGKLSYMSSEIIREGTGARAKVVEDILGKLDAWTKEANFALGGIFKGLNATLVDKEVSAPCGVFNFRFYERTVKPSEAKSFNGGRCKSRTWFDSAPDENKCPLRDRCGAYANAAPKPAGASA